MEFDDLKNTWDNQANQQQLLTSKLIDQMTQKKYNSKINRIAYPEIIGTIICLLAVMYIGLNFYKLDTIFFQCVGILSIMVLLTLSVLSFVSLRHLKISNDFNKSYAEALNIFAKEKLVFYRMQKINMTLSYLLLVTVTILFYKFFYSRDITGSKYFWIFAICIGYIFLLFATKYVAKFYKNTLKRSEELLQELQS